ncbi:MAG TPA: hypothetical protein V6D47_18745 [Oscillatoriaceae cyanobacterium]
MKKLAAKTKKTALVNVNPYLSNPELRETVTVMAVNSANRMEGIKVDRKVTREHYRVLTEEAAVPV